MEEAEAFEQEREVEAVSDVEPTEGAESDEREEESEEESEEHGSERIEERKDKNLSEKERVRRRNKLISTS